MTRTKGMLCRTGAAMFVFIQGFGTVPALAQTVSIPSDQAPVIEDHNRITFDPDPDRPGDWETTGPDDAGDDDNSGPDDGSDGGNDGSDRGNDGSDGGNDGGSDGGQGGSDGPDGGGPDPESASSRT